MKVNIFESIRKHCLDKLYLFFVFFLHAGAITSSLLLSSMLYRVIYSKYLNAFRFLLQSVINPTFNCYAHEK